MGSSGHRKIRVAHCWTDGFPSWVGISIGNELANLNPDELEEFYSELTRARDRVRRCEEIHHMRRLAAAFAESRASKAVPE